jgi:signal transduction histidine kinase
MFARRKLSQETFEALESVARTIAIGSERTARHRARRHGQPGSARPRRDREEVIRLSVRNTEAIAAPDLPALFDPFRRAASDSKTRKSKGLGLGLYIVQQIVHVHGGRIAARPSDVEGTVFIVKLPRVAPGASCTRLEPKESS